MKKLTKWAGIVLSVLMLAMTMTGVAVAQDELPPCVLDNGLQLSCILFRMTPNTLVGEFWVNDFHVETDPPKINAFLDIEFVSGVKAKFEFRNIEDPTDPNFNVLYVYKDVSKAVTSPPLSQWKVYELKPTKQYIRQSVELTCNIKSWVDENVSCAINIDGVDQANLILAGQKDHYALDPGPHTVVFTLVGDATQTILWSPASVTKKFNATASATVSKQTANFTKAGHLLAGMDQPGALADWYLDGTQVGTQVATFDQWVDPSKSHKLEIKNINDATLDAFSAYIFHWKDAKQSPFVGSGKEKTVTFKLLKEGNWAQPFEYVVPKGSLVDGPHSYTLTSTCPDGTASNTVAFTVDPLAKVIFPELYLRFTGVERKKLTTGDTVEPINGKQALKALVTFANRDKTVVEGLAGLCSASINLDGVDNPLTPGTIYRIKP